MAQLGLPDMKIPISLALNYLETPFQTACRRSILHADAGRLTFEKPDMETFPCLKLAYDALEAGDTYCTALNAANEVCEATF